MKKHTLLFLAVSFFTVIFCSKGKAQVVDNTLTPAQLVQQVFLGQGINVFNVTFIGDSTQQIGKFSGFTSFGIDSGIVLTTGLAADIAQDGGSQASTQIQPADGEPFDQDLTTLLQENSPGVDANDPAILEFDFVPLGDSVRFDYIFGSEEYPEFVCSFNDGFGMFLSGPGISGPYSNNSANIALIPGTTTPVSIYNVNGTNSTGGCAWVGNNSDLYVDNAGGTEFVYDGFTTVLRAEAQVICGQTYHLKIAIADAGDRSYDSGVLLKARSLVSNQVSLEALSPGGDSTLVEGCAAGNFQFFRPGLLTDTLFVPVTYSGTAIMGLDYNTLPDTIVFLPDSNLVSIPVIPTADGIVEGIESIIATIIQETCDGTAFNTISQSFYIVPPTPIQAIIQDIVLCPGDAGTLTANTTGGFFPISFLWSTGETTQSISVSPGATQDFWVTVNDGCTNTTDTDTGRVVIGTLVPVLVNANLTSLPEACGLASITFSIPSPQSLPYSVPVSISGSATNGTDYSTFPSTITFPAGITSLNFTLNVTPDLVVESNETVTIGVTVTSSCDVSTESVTITILEAPQPLSLIIDSVGTQECPNDLVTLNAIGSGGTGNFTYTWINSLSATGASVDVTPAINTTYTVVLKDSLCGVQITDTANLTLNVPVISPVNIPSIGTVNILCPGTSITLTINPSQVGNGIFNYLWEPNGETTNSIGITANQTAEYVVTATGKCGLQDSIHFTVNVPVYSPLTLSLSPERTVRCVGDTININAYASGGLPGLNYSWNGSGFSKAPSYSLPVNDTLFVVLTARDTCNNIFNQTVRINTPVYGELSLVTSLDTAACPNSWAPISVTPSFGAGIYSYLWTALSGTDQISSPTTDTASVMVTSTHDYLINVTDICGNSKTDTVNVRLKACNIDIPNIFTPNGDALNSRFLIKGVSEYPNTTVLIYDRWGKKVKEITNYNDENAWDGKDADTGTYFYVVLFSKEGIESKNGTVQLLR